MYRLVRQQRIHRPLDEVFAFFADAANLERITPPELGFQILTPRPITLEAGTTIDYRLRLYGVRFRWRTLIDEFVPGVRFVDTQARGPYRSWRHTHRFTADGDATLVEDEVDYELPLGPLGWLAHTMAVERQLRRIFDYRRRVVDEVFAA